MSNKLFRKLELNNAIQSNRVYTSILFMNPSMRLPRRRVGVLSSDHLSVF